MSKFKYFLLKANIRGFLNYHLFRKKYSIKNYYIDYIQQKYPKFKNTVSNDKFKNLLLSDWVYQFTDYEKIVVLASGPSLNKLHKLSKKNLYITTNNSVYKAIAYNFIYFTFTKEYISLYLRHGFNEEGWQGTIFRFTKSKITHKERMLGFKRVVDYKNQYFRRKPELLLTDIFDNGVEKDNFDELNDFIEQNFDFKFSDLNSGITILLLGYYFAKKLNKELHIYGLDAGIGGQKYYISKNKPGTEISDNRAKSALDKILRSMYSQKDFMVKNYSLYNVSN